MSKAFGKLFGEREAEYQSTPTTFSTLPGFGQEAFQQAVARGTELSNQPGLFAPAGLTPEQQSALSTLQTGLQPTSANQFQQGLSVFSNPFESQVVQSAINDIVKQGRGMFSDIGTQASAAGGFGGTRQALLESELQNSILKNIGDVSGQLRSQGFETAANRTLSDLARTQDVASNLFSLGDVQRQIQTQQQQAPITAVNYLAQLAAGLPTGGGVSGVSYGGTEGILKQLGGLAGGVGGAMMGLGALGVGGGVGLSDNRVKENIKKVGTNNGFNIYEFNYKGTPQKYKGVMAQEVVEIMPEAVSVHESGYLMVNYGKLGFNMELVA